jgi:hypothetical protein
MARRGIILAIVGVVCWIATLAIVLSSVFNSRKINANMRGVGQAHHSDNRNERSRITVID